MCPKFKHYSGTMTLQTRVNAVVCIRNMGFSQFYNEVFKRLKINVTKQPFLSIGIDRIAKNKNKNRIRHALAEFKRARKHGEMARKREAVLESRTEDYKTRVAVGINSRDDDNDESKDENEKK